MLRIEEIEASIREAAAGKSRRGVVRRTLEHIHERAESIRHSLLCNQWHPCSHEVRIVQEGAHRKKRNIVKPSWYHEQIIHHMLARQLAKIYGPRMYFYTAGTVKRPGTKKGHGPLFCKRVVKRWRDKFGGRKFYVAELDIRKFFDSIDIEVLKNMLSRRIRDRRFLAVLFEIIDTAAPGIPKGFYLSPWLAQIYLSDLDEYIQQKLRPCHCLRFVDNYIILHPNKRELHRIVQGIEDYLRDRLHLTLNGSKQIYRFEHELTPSQIERVRERDRQLGLSGRYSTIRGRPINCVGYVIHHNRITMRKAILKRARAKALRMHRKRRCTVHDAGTMLSYKGWFRQTNTYGYYQRWIKPNVSMRYCRRRLSRMAKRNNRQGGNANGNRVAQGT